ncbi:MAG: phenylacetic acid degradation protein [Saprospirales bacterium]|nr:MAG: phenylacetic acid degradation protein [Saprospirales bacterium]
MSSQFSSYNVSKINRETEDAVSVELQPADGSQIPDFLPGQYLTIRAFFDGEEIRRSYSICSSPAEGILRVGIKRLKGGKFSTYANDILKEGDTVEVMEPMGKFTHSCNQNNQNHYIGFAAGSGITPILSIVKSILREEPNSRFSLFYGNKRTGDIMFKEEIEGLKNIYLNRFSVYHILSKEKSDIPLFEGRIDRPKLEKFAKLFFDPKKVNSAFICGPLQMTENIAEFLKEQKIDENQVKFELFTTEGVKKRAVDKEEIAKNIEAESVAVSLRIDGDIYDFNMDKKGVTILDGAANTGADVPYACKGGVCSTCRAKLISGEVHMEVNYALEKDELEQGFILTCQSYPKTEKVEVDFDIK